MTSCQITTKTIIFGHVQIAYTIQENKNAELFSVCASKLFKM